MRWYQMLYVQYWAKYTWNITHTNNIHPIFQISANDDNVPVILIFYSNGREVLVGAGSGYITRPLVPL